MSFVGNLNIFLDTDDNCVRNAAVKASSEVSVEKLFIGKTQEEVFELIPILFSLCPDSQSAAAKLALYEASGQGTTEIFKDCIWQNYLEIINEGVRFFLLQLAPEAFRKRHIHRIVEIRAQVSELKKVDPRDSEKVKEEKRKLADLALPLLLADFGEDWEQDLLNGFTDETSEDIPSIFAALNSHRNLGWCSLPLLKKTPRVLLEDVKEKKLWMSKGHKFDIKHLTGAVARQRKDPLISYLLAQDGNTAYTRLCARFVELITTLMDDFPSEVSASVLKLEDKCALSVIQNSRGVLFHFAKLEEKEGKNVIADYGILTPTELNVTDTHAFNDSLKDISGQSEDELKKLVYLVVSSYDPCVQINIEVNKNA